MKKTVLFSEEVQTAAGKFSLHRSHEESEVHVNALYDRSVLVSFNGDLIARLTVGEATALGTVLVDVAELDPHEK